MLRSVCAGNYEIRLGSKKQFQIKSFGLTKVYAVLREIQVEIVPGIVCGCTDFASGKHPHIGIAAKKCCHLFRLFHSYFPVQIIFKSHLC